MENGSVRTIISFIFCQFHGNGLFTQMVPFLSPSYGDIGPHGWFELFRLNLRPAPPPHLFNAESFCTRVGRNGWNRIFDSRTSGFFWAGFPILSHTQPRTNSFSSRRPVVCLEAWFIPSPLRSCLGHLARIRLVQHSPPQTARQLFIGFW